MSDVSCVICHLCHTYEFFFKRGFMCHVPCATCHSPARYDDPYCEMRHEEVARMLVASLGVCTIDDVRALRLYTLALADQLFEDAVRMLEHGCGGRVGEKEIDDRETSSRSRGRPRDKSESQIGRDRERGRARLGIRANEIENYYFLFLTPGGAASKARLLEHRRAALRAAGGGGKQDRP